MAKAINPVLISGLIKKCKKYFPDIESAEGKANYLKELESPTLDMFEFESDFKRLFLPCIMDEDCMGEIVRSDENYVYFKIDEEKANAITGVDTGEYLYSFVYKPMCIELDQDKHKSKKYFNPDEWEYGYYIRFDPVKYCESGIARCFDIVVTLGNKICDYLPELTDIYWLESHGNEYIDFIKTQYRDFAKYAVKKTKQYIRSKLFQEIDGKVAASKLDGNTYFQSVADVGDNTNYVVQDWLGRISRNDSIKWYEIYKNLVVALN